MMFIFLLNANEFKVYNTYELAKSCKNNNKDDCKKLEKIIMNYDRQCDNKIIKSCILNGVAFFELDKDKYKHIFMDYYNKACNLDGNFSAFACNFLTNEYIEFYLDGKTDYLKEFFIEEAKKYFKKGCDKGDKNSCNSVEMINNGFYKKVLDNNFSAE